MTLLHPDLSLKLKGADGFLLGSFCYNCITFLFGPRSASEVLSLSVVPAFHNSLAVQFHYLKVVYSHDSLLFSPSSFYYFQSALN